MLLGRPLYSLPLRAPQPRGRGCGRRSCWRSRHRTWRTPSTTRSTESTSTIALLSHVSCLMSLRWGRRPCRLRSRPPRLRKEVLLAESSSNMANTFDYALYRIYSHHCVAVSCLMSHASCLFVGEGDLVASARAHRPPLTSIARVWTASYLS